MKKALIFLGCVRSEGTIDQLVVGDKMIEIIDSISPNNLLIQVEKISRSRSDYIPLVFLMQSFWSHEIMTQLEMVMYIQQSGVCQYVGYFRIPIRIKVIVIE